MQQLMDSLDTVKGILSYMKIGDLIEILIIAFLVYHIIIWIKTSRAWYLLKGLIVILVFLLIAKILEMNTILWIASNVMTFAATAVIVVLQPELRKVLEELGKKNVLYSVFSIDSRKKTDENYSDKTVNEIAKACVEMSKVRTGALIVIEAEDSLADYERTGIDVDGIVSSQLLINIFEHNTPLHDGAVLIHGNRIVSATCYLPLSDNMNLGKELGTRHRAGVGISEVTDSLTVIVSEETGKISIAYKGKLEEVENMEQLKAKLKPTQNKDAEPEKTKRIFKGRSKT